MLVASGQKKQGFIERSTESEEGYTEKANKDVRSFFSVS